MDGEYKCDNLLWDTILTTPSLEFYICCHHGNCTQFLSICP